MIERGRESEMGRKTKSWENMEERRTNRLENVPPCLLRCPRNARLEKKRRPKCEMRRPSHEPVAKAVEEKAWATI